jgi:hypothetical protein
VGIFAILPVLCLYVGSENMIFQYTLTQVVNCTKTQTRRVVSENELAIRTRYNQIDSVVCNGRTKWKVGSTYAVQPGRGQSQVARIRLVKINSERVSRISHSDALAEGFTGRQDFLRTWSSIHGMNSFDRRVWVLKFELIAISVDNELFIRTKESHIPEILHSATMNVTQ